MGQFFRRLRYLLFRSRYDRALEADIAFHREMAALHGQSNFGNSLRLREESRDAWGWTWLDRLAQDLRYASRILARSPGFTLSAVLILAIGIGINIAAFSLFNIIALKPLPVPNPASIVRLQRRSPTASTSEISYPSFCFYRDHARSLASATAVLGVPPMQLDNDDTPTSASFVTPNYFSDLGLRPAFGRLLDPSLDSSPSALPPAVLSYSFWQRRFAADPNAVGRTIHLDGKPVLIAGVLPYAAPTLGAQTPSLWLPMAAQPYLVEGSKTLTNFDDSAVRMWARLAPGVSPSAAAAELLSLTTQLRRLHPSAVWPGEFLDVAPGGRLQVMTPEMYQVAAMAGTLTLLILAAACANLGGLLLARSLSREREFSIRAALGAGRSRIFRQLATESLLLAALGAAAGLALAFAILRLSLSLLDAPKWISPSPDARVLLVALALSLFSALLFGFAPALQSARRHRKALARQILIAAQVAASSVLLIVSSLLVRAAQHTLFTSPGFGYESTVSIDPQLAHHGYSDAAARAYLDQFQARLRALPNVRSLSLVRLPPMGHVTSYETRQDNGHSLKLYPNWVSPDYFQTLQIPLLAGRSFRPGDKDVVIVSSSLARLEWAGANPLGKSLPGAHELVIGVAGDAHTNALSDDDATEAYFPAQPSDLPAASILVRVSGPATSLLPAARSIGASLDPKIFLEQRPLKSLYLNQVSAIEKAAAAVSLAGLAALALAATGILGLVAFSVSQRTREIAIRLALGSRPAPLCAALLAQFLWPVSLGLLAGASLAAAGSRLLRVALFGVSNLDPLGYASALAFLLAIVLLAALAPIRRALHLDIPRALHTD